MSVPATPIYLLRCTKSYHRMRKTFIVRPSTIRSRNTRRNFFFSDT